MPVIRVVQADVHAVGRQGIRDLQEEDRDIEVVAEAPDGETANATHCRLRLHPGRVSP
jgi:DNA-binding NarL/FixJ family response regulator